MIRIPLSEAQTQRLELAFRAAADHNRRDRRNGVRRAQPGRRHPDIADALGTSTRSVPRWLRTEADRPKDFTTKDSTNVVFVFQRVQKDKNPDEVQSANPQSGGGPTQGREGTKTMRFLFPGLAAGFLVLVAGQALGATQRSQGTPVKDISSAALTDQGLRKMIENLGYEPEILKGSATPIYRLAIQRDGLAYRMDLELSPNRKKVWLSIWFTRLGPGQKLPPTVLVQMLEANERWGPAHYRYDSQTRQVSVALPLDNRALTPAELRAQMDYLLEVTRRTRSLWDPKKWNAGAGALEKSKN